MYRRILLSLTPSGRRDESIDLAGVSGLRPGKA